MPTSENDLASLSASERKLLKLLEDRLTKKLDERLGVIQDAIEEALAQTDDDDDDDDDLDERS
jgi:hypothetical protein